LVLLCSKTRSLAFQFSRDRIKEEFFERLSEIQNTWAELCSNQIYERKNIIAEYKFIQYWFSLHNNRNREISQIIHRNIRE